MANTNVSKLKISVFDVTKNKVIFKGITLTEMSEKLNIDYNTLNTALHRNSLIAKRYRITEVGEFVHEPKETVVELKDRIWCEKWDSLRIKINPCAVKS